ncbi:uncharacterized protein ColSpa_10762 [Colletotrichum spaethianum]|uniref:NPP1 domain-containing protein n=1 Tax=Colletotrichum spaethianum TaxID=700344 RepID=A0AA37UKT9_9PEZI|nr:uncharacterized protein ColSpa_10762 [Colletotrichum spaethianum]GKT50581.1 hypothetical protein ColSpa_10762 [Colletotrichum spaethianum]
MLRHSLLSLFSLGLTVLVSGRTLSPRDGDVAVDNKWKDHSAIIPLQQQSAGGLRGELELRFKPSLNDKSGCFPYAAVDKDGYHGVGFSDNSTGVMYSWYLPKIQTNTENHKHWYLTVVVWLYTKQCNPTASDYTVAGVSYSTGTEAWDKASSSSTIYSSGDSGTGSVNTHALVAYDGQVNVYPSADSAEDALTPPMISWDALPQAAADQFNGVTYEYARCPFTEANFQNSLDAAYNGDFYINIGDGSDSAACSEDPSTTEPSTTEPSTTDPPTSTSTSDADVEPVENGSDLVPSSIPTDPTWTPTPGTSQTT